MQQPVTLILKNINPAQNRRRVYAITVSGFSVQLRWGRLDCHARQKVVTFQEEARLLRFLQATLRKRGRNGYRISEASDGFPMLKAMEGMEFQKVEPVQLSLFAEEGGAIMPGAVCTVRQQPFYR